MQKREGRPGRTLERISHRRSLARTRPTRVSKIFLSGIDPPRRTIDDSRIRLIHDVRRGTSAAAHSFVLEDQKERGWEHGEAIPSLSTKGKAVPDYLLPNILTA